MKTATARLPSQERPSPANGSVSFDDWYATWGLLESRDVLSQSYPPAEKKWVSSEFSILRFILGPGAILLS